MKQTYFHGTTEENARKILSGQEKSDCTWYDSDDDFLYFWGVEELATANWEEGEEQDIKRERAMDMAKESALITYSLGKHSNKIVVLEFEIDPEEVEEDLSSENMAGFGAVRVAYNKEIISLCVGAFEMPVMSELRVFLLATIVERTNINSCFVSKSLWNLAQKMKDQVIFVLEDLPELCVSNLEKCNLI